MRRALLGLLALVPTFAVAQTESETDPIATIRPRVTDTTRIVPVGRFQLESGADFGYGGLDIFRHNAYGLVGRYGVAPRLELRLEAPTFNDYRIPYNDGFGNTSVSASYLLGRKGPVWFAVRPRLTLPSGVAFRQPDEPAPSVFFTAESEVANVWLLAATVGGIHERFDGDSEDVMRASLCVERYVDSRFSGFVEYVGTYLRDTSPGHAANLGARLSISHREQVDVHWNLPISDSISSRTVGVGYSIRF